MECYHWNVFWNMWLFPFITHLPFQHTCLFPLNYIIVIFLKFQSAEARLLTKQHYGPLPWWGPCGMEVMKGWQMKTWWNMTLTLMSQPPYIFTCLIPWLPPHFYMPPHNFQCVTLHLISNSTFLHQSHWFLMFSSGSQGEILEGGILLHPITPMNHCW